ncbi:MAG TPA: CoA transferase [Candidatus Udaeobacter sp.]|nr:CoA transferase [Candidatus Udaeobacter sp.]
MTDFLSLEALAAGIPDGAHVAIPPDYSGVAMAATRALIRRGVRGLKLLSVPTAGLQADLLIGAGCVAEIETAGIALGEAGSAPRFIAALKAGALAIKDTTCPAIHAALQAAEKGIPFIPLRGIIGSDLVGRRPDWRVVDNPFVEGDPILLLPAIAPDVALFHASLADRKGNLWIGRRRELATMAHAARRTLVTVERIQDEDLLADEASAAGTLSSLYITAIAEAPQGVWPLGLAELYATDDAHMALYAAAARTEEGFRNYLGEYARL